MRLALYARVSTDKQDADQQIKDCLSLCKWGEPVIFTEYQSAWKDKDRPEFEAIVKQIKARQLDHLIVWDLDRLYRNRLKIIEFFRLCKAYGCTIHSFRQKWLEDISNLPNPWNDIMFDLMLNVMGWLAEEESSKKSDRVKKAVIRDSGKTLSYKGKKWGRKQLSDTIKEQIKTDWKKGYSIRQIAKIHKLGVGTVHKYLAKIKADIDIKIASSEMGQLTNTKKGDNRNLAALEIFKAVLAKEAPKTRVLPIPENRLKSPLFFSENMENQGDDKEG